MIILAKNAGFCFGVKRAVEAAETNIDNKIVTLGHIIHNDSVIKSLESRGVRCVNDISEVNNEETIVIRSHGEPPKTYREIESRGLSYIDATCPYVKRIHDRVCEASNEGLPVIIVGEKGHPEVDGIIGWAGEGSFIVNSEEEVEMLPDMNEAVAVAQTTITEEKWDSIISLLYKKVNNLIPFKSICSATKERQDEAREIAKKADAVIVVGGKHSSNTRKLYELCQKYCKNTYYIEHYKELLLEKMIASDIIGIVAGASTPDTVIREVFDYMTENEKVLSVEEGGTCETVTASDIAEEATEAADTAVGTPDMASDEAQNKDTEVTSEKEEVTEAVAETEADVEEHVEVKPPTEADVFLEGLEKVIRLKKGQMVTGTIVQLTDDDISVNIGYKSDGMIHKDEMCLNDANPKDVFKIGDEIEAEVINLNDGEGNVLLSRKRIERKENWSKMKENVGSEKVFKCVIRKAVKGGVTTKIDGYSTFIPASHLSLKFVEDLKDYEGKEIEVTIIDADKKQERLVASHKSVLLSEKREKEEQVWNSFAKGDIVKGVVKRLTEFGAFVDIGGIDGLLHISDMAWSRIKHPSDVVAEGQELELLILNVDPAKKKIALGFKQLQPKPWETVTEKYQVGDTVTGKVVRIVPFGAFVQLEPTIDGLIHISQISRHRLERVEDELKIGDTVEVKVLEVNPEKRKISLSRKALLPEEPKVEKKEKPVDEENYRYEIPPVEESTISLADFFPKKDE